MPWAWGRRTLGAGHRASACEGPERGERASPAVRRPRRSPRPRRGLTALRVVRGRRRDEGRRESWRGWAWLQVRLRLQTLCPRRDGSDGLAGKALAVTGPESLTMAEHVRTIGEVLGRPLRCRRSASTPRPIAPAIAERSGATWPASSGGGAAPRPPRPPCQPAPRRRSRRDRPIVCVRAARQRAAVGADRDAAGLLRERRAWHDQLTPTSATSCTHPPPRPRRQPNTTTRAEDTCTLTNAAGLPRVPRGAGRRVGGRSICDLVLATSLGQGTIVTTKTSRAVGSSSSTRM